MAGIRKIAIMLTLRMFPQLLFSFSSHYLMLLILLLLTAAVPNIWSYLSAFYLISFVRDTLVFQSLPIKVVFNLWCLVWCLPLSQGYQMPYSQNSLLKVIAVSLSFQSSKAWSLVTNTCSSHLSSCFLPYWVNHLTPSFI